MSVSVQVLRTLDPTHRVSLDIASYFRPRENDQLNGEEEESFPEVPTAGLNRRRSKRKKTTAKTSKQKSSKSEGSKTIAVPASQPLIEHALRGTATSISRPAAIFTETDLPLDAIDELFDFESQPLVNEGVAPPTGGDSDNCRDDTPPLDGPATPQEDDCL